MLMLGGEGSKCRRTGVKSFFHEDKREDAPRVNHIAKKIKAIVSKITEMQWTANINGQREFIVGVFFLNKRN